MRAKKACTFCKKRKIRCDTNSPCSNCVQRELECSYEVNSIDQLKYIKNLENKIKKLENENFALNKDSYAINHYTSSVARFGISTRNHISLPKKLATSMLSCLGEEERNQFPIPRTQHYGWNMSGGHYLKQRSLPEFKQLIDLNNSEELEVCHWLLDFFFKKINPLYSIIHQKVFRIQFSNYLIGIESTSSRSSRLFCSILYLIFAISIRYSEFDPKTPSFVKQKITPYLEEEFFTTAYDTVVLLSFEWQSFELIQSWILITFYLRTTHRQNSSFGALGTAIRMCKGMSLNLKDTIKSVRNNNNYEQLKIKRIFWLVYTWDRLYSYQHGDQIELRDDIITHDIEPLDCNDPEDDWIERPALVMIHLAKYCGDILLSTLYKSERDGNFIEEIRKDLFKIEIWFNKNIKTTEFDPIIISQVHLTYHDMILSIYNRSIFQLIDEEEHPLANTGIKQSSILLQSSSKTMKVFEDLETLGYLKLPWFLNLSILFNISLISIGFINSGLYFEVSSNNLQKCVNFFDKLESDFKMAKERNYVIKLLNHICSIKSINTSNVLSNIGTNHGPKNLNESNFFQFSTKLEEENNNEFQYDELIQGNLKWFDQWFKDLETS